MTTIEIAENQMREAIVNALKKAIADGALPEAELPSFVIEEPNDRSHGDLAANAAMVGARAFRLPPRKIAEAIAERIDLTGTCFEKDEVAGAGFLNFFFSPSFYANAVAEVLQKGDDYGKSDAGKGEKVMVEYVSANPTGPMHMGNARGGALGDCLASVMDAAGFDVWREFYVNDAGNQIEKFAISLETRYLQIFKGEKAVPLPEDAYHGDDIIEHAKNFAAIHGDKFVEADERARKDALVEYALPLNLEKMHKDLEKYRIVYDKWFLESELHKNGDIQDIVNVLTEKGLTYEKDGAVWYKNAEVLTKQLLAEGKSQADIDKLELKDDVLIRANGNPTYFAADIAYHRNKFLRGFNTCIDVWGADHHGHVARMKGAMDSVGIGGEHLQVLLVQLVRLMQDGKPVKMSKRSGKAIQLADLLDEVPCDAARFFFNMTSATNSMDFDLDLAVEESSQNPVYYVQYAHARICSIFKKLEEQNISLRECKSEELELLSSSEEKELIRFLSSFTSEIASAAIARDPAKITRYSMELATLFHKFYNGCRVLCDDESLMQARLSLCKATKITLKNALTLLKVSVPESM